MRFTNEQLQTLRAAVDRIIPPDDYPGAYESGVSEYLIRQFESDLRSAFADYCAGLSGLEAEAHAKFQQSFAHLPNDQQDAVLRQTEAGEVVTHWEVQPRLFFNLLVNTTAEGFYSNPEQGGNRDCVSWTMTGFEEHLS